jgi:hypothetical protein
LAPLVGGVMLAAKVFYQPFLKKIDGWMAGDCLLFTAKLD